MTSIWNKYKKSSAYLDEHNIVGKNNWYWDMYIGDQWKDFKGCSKELPVFNFIQQVVDYKTSAIGQNQMTAVFSDSEANPNKVDLYKNINNYWTTCFDKENLSTKIYEALLQSAVEGDAYLYFGTKDKSQLIPTSSILLADEQNQDLQSQEYIMIRERRFVKDIKEIAKSNNVEGIEAIAPDKETEYITGNQDDIDYNGDDGKITSVTYFEKRNGVVYVGKSVKGCDYEPLRALEIDDNGRSLFGSKLYPIAKLTCKKIPNSARGRGWVQDLIPNQIEYNKTASRMSLVVQHMAFPRMAFDSNAVLNPDDLTNVGVPIELNGNAQSISSMIAYLQGAPISSDIFNYTENLFTLTKQINGANDAITGISDPTRVSGEAVAQIREQSTQGLKGNVIALKKFYEDIARIRLDTWQTYYSDGIEVIRTPTDEEKIMINQGEEIDLKQKITGEELREIIPNITIDVSLQTFQTKESTQAILDDKLEKNYITFREWVESSDDNGPIPKSQFLKILEKRGSERLPQDDMTLGQDENMLMGSDEYGMQQM